MRKFFFFSSAIFPGCMPGLAPATDTAATAESDTAADTGSTADEQLSSFAERCDGTGFRWDSGAMAPFQQITLSLDPTGYSMQEVASVESSTVGEFCFRVGADGAQYAFSFEGRTGDRQVFSCQGEGEIVGDTRVVHRGVYQQVYIDLKDPAVEDGCQYKVVLGGG